jgi:hypothetical protein
LGIGAKKLASQPVKPKAQPQTYTYSGIIWCGNCGSSMHGTKMSVSKKTGKLVLVYLCGTYNRWPSGERDQCPCKAYKVKQAALDDAMREHLLDGGKLLAQMAPHVEARTPDVLVQVIRKVVASHTAMRERVGATIGVVRDAAGAAQRVMELPDTWVGEGAVMLVPEWQTDELDALYRETYQDESYGIENRLGTLRARQDTLLERLDKLPKSATSTLARTQKEIEEVDAQTRDAERFSENAADAYVDAEREFERLSRDWDAAQVTLSGESQNRRKAEAIRRVVERITVTFRPTGRKNPAGEVANIDIKTNADCGYRGTLPPATRSRSAS